MSFFHIYWGKGLYLPTPQMAIWFPALIAATELNKSITLGCCQQLYWIQCLELVAYPGSIAWLALK